MISDNLKHIYKISIFLFIAHGIEEYLTGFYLVDWVLFGYLSPKISQPAFVVFQLLLWSLLVLVAKGAFNPKWTKRLILLAGAIYVLEVHHLIDAFLDNAYYPGSITALAFPIIALFFWKEFIRNQSKTK